MTLYRSNVFCDKSLTSSLYTFVVRVNSILSRYYWGKEFRNIDSHSGGPCIVGCQDITSLSRTGAAIKASRNTKRCAHVVGTSSWIRLQSPLSSLINPSEYSNLGAALRLLHCLWNCGRNIMYNEKNYLQSKPGSAFTLCALVNSKSSLCRAPL